MSHWKEPVTITALSLMGEGRTPLRRVYTSATRWLGTYQATPTIPKSANALMSSDMWLFLN